MTGFALCFLAIRGFACAFLHSNHYPATKHLDRSIRPRLEELEDRCVPSTMYFVNSLGDIDLGGVSTSGTLRHVINLANANHTGTAGAPDLIQFTTGGGTMSVNALNGGGLALAANEVAVIDATNATGYAGTPIITLDGSLAGVGANGLTISGGSSTVKGFDIVNFSGSGLRLDTNGQDAVLSNYIGITTAGVAAANHGDGILVVGTSGNVIGSTTAMGGNVISGNVLTGIHLLGNGLTLTNNNLIEGNYIGTNAAGTAAVGNGAQGITISDASANTVGGSVAGAQRHLRQRRGRHSRHRFNLFEQSDRGQLYRRRCDRFHRRRQRRQRHPGHKRRTIEHHRRQYSDGHGLYREAGRTATSFRATAPTASCSPTAPGSTRYRQLHRHGPCRHRALGNALDGVAILNGADNNSLSGTTLPQPPFVFLNLVERERRQRPPHHGFKQYHGSGQLLRPGRRQHHRPGNHLDGVLIEGTSTNTQFGGVIPLGNISRRQRQKWGRNRRHCQRHVVFNTFCGLPAFVDTAVGNALDGMLITSTGGNNLLRTNVIAGNGANGVHIGGGATGVQVAEDIIGMDTNGQSPLPNAADGVLIDGNAHDNLIGGLQVSVIPQNTISANGANGIAIVGNANGNQVFHSFIGTDISGIGPSEMWALAYSSAAAPRTTPLAARACSTRMSSAATWAAACS